MVERPFSITNSSGDTIRGDLRYEEGGPPRPVLIVCHGFTAHKDWGPFPYFGSRLAGEGFASIVFNFSHNGIGSDFKRFTEIVKFSRNTISKELDDVKAIVDAVGTGKVGSGFCDRSRLGILGHSRGGGIAILFASLDSRAKGVAAWSSVGTFFRYTEQQRTVWKEQGFLPVRIRSMPTRLRYGIELLEDLESHKELYDLQKAVRRLQVPLLLIHGKEDLSVKPKEVEELYEVADASRTELILLDHVGHMYGAENPFTGTNPTIERIIQLTSDWFHRIL